MDEMQIYGRLEKIFEDVLDQDSMDVKPESSVREMDGCDSLTYIRLIVTIEKEFGMKFVSSEMGEMETVRDFVSVIQARTESNA